MYFVATFVSNLRNDSKDRVKPPLGCFRLTERFGIALRLMRQKCMFQDCQNLLQSRESMHAPLAFFGLPQVRTIALRNSIDDMRAILYRHRYP